MEQINYGEVKKIPRDQIRPFADQPRTHFDQVSLKELADSIEEVGQKIPILVKQLTPPVNGHIFELVDGQRRWIACGMINRVDMLAWVIKVNDENDQFVTSVVSNFGREGHTVLEIAHAVKRIKDMGKTLGELTKIFGKSSTWVCQHLSILKLPQEVLELLGPETPEEKRLTFSTALLLTGIPEPHQAVLGKMISEMGLSMSQSRHMIAKTVHTQGLKRSRNRPDREFQVLYGFVARANEHLEMVLDTSVQQLREILRGGKLQDRMRLLEMLEENTEQFKALQQMVEKIEEEKGKPVAT